MTRQADDACRLGQLARELCQPLEGRSEIGVRTALLDDLLEHGERRLVETKMKQAFAQEELRLLYVGGCITRLPFDDTLELNRSLAVRLLLIET